MAAKVHDGMTAKRRLTIELARIRRHKRLLPPIAPPPGGGGPGTGTVLGSGTTGHVAKWIAVDTLGDSLIRDDGATVSIVRTSAPVDIFKILDTDASLMLDIDREGLVGINCDPDGMLTIQAGGLVAPITAGLVGWYRAAESSPALDNTAIATWRDSSPAGNHLTATGCTVINNPSGVRPKYNAAGTSKGMTNLPTVSFEGVIAGDMGYFTFDTTRIALTGSTGYTIALIYRSYANDASDSYIFGANTYGGGGDNGNSFIKRVYNATNTRWDTQETSGKSFCGLYSITAPPVDEIVVLRRGSTGNGNALKAWLNGSPRTLTGDTQTTAPFYIRYIGRILSAVGNTTGVYGKAFAEILIWDRDLSDSEVDTVNVYLASRQAGTTAGVSYDIQRWKNPSGALKGRVDAEGNLILPRAANATTGVIFRDIVTPYRWMHDHTHNVDGTHDDFPNLFIGKNAGNFTVSGDGTPTFGGTANIGIGELTLSALVDGYSNIGIGYHALGSCTTGFFNFGLGEEALGSTTTGFSNTAVGDFSLAANTIGTNNVAVGKDAGGTNDDGDQNTFLGDSADSTGTGFNNQIAIGFGVAVDASNKTVIGNTSTTKTEIRGDLSLWNLADTFKATFDTSLLTANRTYTLPNVAGTFTLGTGTPDVLPKWTSANVLGDSLFSDDGTNPAFHSSGAAKALFDTSLLEAVNAGDKLFYLWEQDIAQSVGGPGSGFNTIVVGGSEAGTYGDGSMAMWSLDGNYPTTLRATGVYWQNDRDLFVSDFGGAGANLILGTSGVTRTEIRQPHTAGIINIQGFGAGARFEITGATSAEVLAVNGKAITRGNHTTEGDHILSVAGKKLKISEAANGAMGTAVLVAGTVVVNTTAVTANSRIQLTAQVLGTVAAPKALAVTARTAGTSFTITSADATDTSTIAWVIFEPS